MAPKLPVLTGTRGDPQSGPQPAANPTHGWEPASLAGVGVPLISFPGQKRSRLVQGRGPSLQTEAQASTASRDGAPCHGRCPRYPRGRALSTGTLATLGYGDLFSETGMVLPSREPQGSPGPRRESDPSLVAVSTFTGLDFL